MRYAERFDVGSSESEVVAMKKLLIVVIAFILAIVAIFFLGTFIIIFEGIGLIKPFITAAVIVLIFMLIAKCF